MTEPRHAAEACRAALEVEVGRLPPDLRLAWQRESRRVIVTLEEAREAKSRCYLKAPKPPGRWAPASSLLIVHPTNCLLAAGRRLHPEVNDLTKILERDTLMKVLDGPLRELGGPTKVIYLRAGKTFVERILRKPTSGLDIMMLRIRAKELARDYSTVLKDYSEYRKAALALEPHMMADEPHDVTSAIMAREKAIANISVSIDPRLGEISDLLLEHVLIDGSDVVIVIPASISKERVNQARALDAECAKPVIEYVTRARPFLNALRRPGTCESNALWLTRTGTTLIQQGVSQALTITLSNAMGVPVGAKILRKVMASREDLAEREIGAALGHALRSLLGIDLYGARDEQRAKRQLVAVWNLVDRDI